LKIYKIRNKEGFFSNGGSNPSFTKQGKSWSNIGHIKSHLGYNSPEKEEFYKDCEVVVFESSILNAFPVSTLINGSGSIKLLTLPKSEYSEELSLLFSFFQDFGIDIQLTSKSEKHTTADFFYNGRTYKFNFKFNETQRQNYCTLELSKDRVCFFTQRLFVDDWNSEDFKTPSLIVQMMKNQMDLVSDKNLNEST